MRVLTYNIHGWATRGGPKARKPNLESVAALLAATKADIIGLNEVFYPRAVPPVLERPALEELARRLDMHVHFGPCVRWPAQDNLPADAYGNAILSRYPILAGAAHHLTPVSGKEPRGLLEARLLLPNGTPFTVYVTHLDHTDEQVRLIQLRALRTWTVRDRNRPHLVIGDFNAINLWDFRDNPQALERLADAPKGSHMAAMSRTDGETSDETGSGPQVIAQMEKAGYIDVYTRFGAPGGQTIVASVNPPVRIDYIFASRSLESSLRGCGIWMEPEGREASDHRPVYADLDIEQIGTGVAASKAGNLDENARQRNEHQPRRRKLASPMKWLNPNTPILLRRLPISTSALPLATNSVLLLILVLGAWIVTTAAGWTSGNASWWAYSFLIYVPVPWRALMAALLLAAGAVALWTQPNLRATGHSAPSLPRAGLLLLPLAGVLFWLGREHTWHGDALLKLELLGSHTLQSDPYVWKEPLDSLLAYTLTALLRGANAAPETAVAISSVLAGVVFAAALLLLARTLDGSTTWRAIFTVGLLATGSTQLWFGHIENYSWVTALTCLTIAFAAGHLAGHTPLWSAGLSAGTAVSFHPQAAFAMPALLLLLRRAHWPRDLVTLALSATVVPGLTLAGLLAAGVPPPNFANGYAGDPQLFWTPQQAFAPHRLFDAFNNLLLIAPAAPLWIAAGLCALAIPHLRRDRTLLYLTAVAAGLLVYHFFFQNDLPRPRDWDLYAIVGPPFTLWGFYSLKLLTQDSTPPRLRHIAQVVLLPTLAFAVLLTTAWVSVNARLTLIRPDTDYRDLYARYRLIDLIERLDSAQVHPPEPLCAGDEHCERVAATTFTMPHTGDVRPTLFAHAPASIRFPLTLPDEPAMLWLSPALDPDAWGWGGDGVDFRVIVVAQNSEELLWAHSLAPSNPAHRDWTEALISLDAYRGQQIDLILVTDPGPAGNDAADRAGWGMPWILRGTLDTRFAP